MAVERQSKAAERARAADDAGTLTLRIRTERLNMDEGR